MQITAEYLTELRGQAEREQRRLLAQAQQTIGAIAVIDAALARLKEPASASVDVTSQDTAISE